MSPSKPRKVGRLKQQQQQQQQQDADDPCLQSFKAPQINCLPGESKYCLRNI